MNFQDKKKISSSELIKELQLTLSDRRKHHVNYKKLDRAEKQRLEHEWAVEFLKESGIVFSGDKMKSGSDQD